MLLGEYGAEVDVRPGVAAEQRAAPLAAAVSRSDAEKGKKQWKLIGCLWKAAVSF